jgi:two-component system sensor histidine kinase BaeS
VSRASLTWHVVVAMLFVSVLSLFLMVILPLYVFPSRLETLPPDIRRDVERILANPEGFETLLERTDNPRLPPPREALRQVLPPRMRMMPETMPEMMPEIMQGGEPANGRLLLDAFRGRLQQLEVIANDVRAERVRSLLLSALAACSIAVVVALFVARRIARPIRVVATAAETLSGGDLSARANLPISSDRDTSLLASNFNHMATVLEKQERERTAMIANIAHELRTPLAVMQARLIALADGVIVFDDAEITRLTRHTERISRLVTDLRTLSLFDAGRLDLNRQQLDVRDVLDNVVGDFSQRVEVSLLLDVPDVPLWVEGDANRLEQLFSNLIDNAVHHASEGVPPATVSVNAQQTDAITVSVQDSGLGLSEEALQHAFDRFYSQAARGGGLGLAIVATLANLHGGTVTASNTTEGGACFTVRLPGSTSRVLL